jgi:DNA-binding transcriptional regulator YhcF (GntR family)
MKNPLSLHVDTRSPIPIRRQLTEQLKHVIESGGLPQNEPLPSIRELASFLGINANTVARVIEDLKRSGYVEARRGSGVFVASAPPVRPAPRLREGFLHDVVIRAAALGMTADDVAVGVLSLGGVPPAVIDAAVEVLLVECSPAELDFFAGQLEASLPIRVDKVLLGELPMVTRRAQAGRWRAAVTSFCHLPEVQRALKGRGVPVTALLAEAHLETLLRLAQLPARTRVGVVSHTVETAHNLEHSIENAALSNVVVVGACRPEETALRHLVRRVDVIVSSSTAAERVRQVADPAIHVIIDDRTLDARAIEMLAVLLVHQNGGGTAAKPATASARRSDGQPPPRTRRAGARKK